MILIIVFGSLALNEKGRKRWYFLKYYPLTVLESIYSIAFCNFIPLLSLVNSEVVN